MRQCTRARDGAAAGARPRGGEVARGTVARIVNGRTFVLGDGLEVCLAAIEVPAVPLPQDAGGSPGGRVQGKLIGDGFARVSDRVGRGSAGELLGRERTAERRGLACGPIRIMTSSVSRLRWTYRRCEADSRWSKARCRPYAKAAQRFT